MKSTVMAVTLGILTASGTALADRSFYDKARVLEVEPIYEVSYVNHPEEHCWTEDVYYRGRGYSDSATPTIVGAILGGVVGNQFGKGGGKKAMTVAGTLLGASVGHDAGKRSSGSYVTQERHCELVDRYDEQEELTGYRVKYSYRGEVFWTTTEEHPGKYIPVNVEVKPAYRHGRKIRF